MRFASLLLVLLSLAACNRGSRSQDAVRQGVLDHLASRGLNVGGMNVEVTGVKFNGDHAEASVTITPKTGPAGAGMNTVYSLDQKGGKWTVTGRKDMGGMPHGGGGTAPGANPHGGGMTMPPEGGGKMPSPQDLPPAGKQK